MEGLPGVESVRHGNPLPLIHTLSLSLVHAHTFKVVPTPTYTNMLTRTYTCTHMRTHAHSRRLMHKRASKHPPTYPCTVRIIIDCGSFCRSRAACGWPEWHHPDDRLALRRRGPRKSGAGRVSPSRADAPAQASAHLWATGDQHPMSSKTTSHAYSQRYCARGPHARLGVILRFLCRWRRRTTTGGYSCFYSWHAPMLGRTWEGVYV